MFQQDDEIHYILVNIEAEDPSKIDVLNFSVKAIEFLLKDGSKQSMKILLEWVKRAYEEDFSQDFRLLLQKVAEKEENYVMAVSYTYHWAP